ncbi:hypothetical protein BsWGS_14671 [Bradybaena similaris]
MTDNVIRREVLRRDNAYGIPACYFWSAEEVANWVQSIGYGKYKSIFLSHFIDGRKLLTVDACVLPKMGITHFGDILDLAGCIRNLLCTGRRIKYKPPEMESAFLDTHFYEYSPIDGLHPEYEYFMWRKQTVNPQPIRLTHPEFVSNTSGQNAFCPVGRRVYNTSKFPAVL